MREGRGCKPSIPQDRVDEVVRLTLHSKPAGEIHWSCRTLAEQVHNDNHRPLTWTATAESSLTRVGRGRVALKQETSSGIHHWLAPTRTAASSLPGGTFAPEHSGGRR